MNFVKSGKRIDDLPLKKLQKLPSFQMPQSPPAKAGETLRRGERMISLKLKVPWADDFNLSNPTSQIQALPASDNTMHPHQPY
jgi:hypothetical protein